MICIAGCRPVVPSEGTTLGARHCSGRHGGLPLQLDVRRAQPTFDLRSSLLTLGKADASIALLSLNRRLHFSLFTFHFSLRAGAVSGQRGYFCGA